MSAVLANWLPGILGKPQLSTIFSHSVAECYYPKSYQKECQKQEAGLLRTFDFEDKKCWLQTGKAPLDICKRKCLQEQRLTYIFVIISCAGLLLFCGIGFLTRRKILSTTGSGFRNCGSTAFEDEERYSYTSLDIFNVQ